MRPKKGRVVAGVCLAIANRFDIDVALVRILWILLLFPGGFPGIIPYIFLIVIIPAEE